MITLQSKTHLKEWLKRAKIDTTTWGADNAKTVVDLWRELQAGETRLQDNPPLRLVDVVQIIIRRGEQILIEVEQELDNGPVRTRNRPPSEKMKGDENYTEAALRGLREELGVVETAVTLHHTTYNSKVSAENSPSYPGLTTRYTFHTVEAQVAGLPDEDFWRDNLSYGKGDPVKRHCWGWRYGR